MIYNLTHENQELVRPTTTAQQVTMKVLLPTIFSTLLFVRSLGLKKVVWLSLSFNASNWFAGRVNSNLDNHAPLKKWKLLEVPFLFTPVIFNLFDENPTSSLLLILMYGLNKLFTFPFPPIGTKANPKKSPTSGNEKKSEKISIAASKKTAAAAAKLYFQKIITEIRDAIKVDKSDGKRSYTTEDLIDACIAYVNNKNYYTKLPKKEKNFNILLNNYLEKNKSKLSKSEVLVKNDLYTKAAIILLLYSTGNIQFLKEIPAELKKV